MKTTLEIPDAIFRRAKSVAAERGIPLREFVTEAVKPSNDVWIAALCRQHSLPLLSRDLHFDAVPGIKRVTW